MFLFFGICDWKGGSLAFIRFRRLLLERENYDDHEEQSLENDLCSRIYEEMLGETEMVMLLLLLR